MTKDEFISKCENDPNVRYKDKFKIKIGNKTYNVNAFGTKMSDRAIKNYINTIESMMDN